jgi:hypothetical protein
MNLFILYVLLYFPLLCSALLYCEFSESFREIFGRFSIRKPFKLRYTNTPINRYSEKKFDKTVSHCDKTMSQMIFR